MVGGTQQFNLRWNNHTSNILQVFLEHLSSESLVDVTLSCQGRFIKAHKIILSACSPYFEEVFAKHTDKHPLIILKDIKYDDLESMIKFMYNGEIRVQEAQLEELLAAAETLQVKGLSNVRSKYEKGEITSLNSVKKLLPPKVADPTSSSSSSSVAKKELPLHAIKAAVALFAPTATTTRVPNTFTTVPAVTTSVSTIGTRVMTNHSYRTVTTIPRGPNAALRAGNIANRATANVVKNLAVATLVPNNLIPLSAPGSSCTGVSTVSRSTPTVLSTVMPSNVSIVTTATTTTTNTVSMILSPMMSASVISNDHSTLTIDPTSITSGASVHFDDIDDIATGIADNTYLTDINRLNDSATKNNTNNDSSVTIDAKSDTTINKNESSDLNSSMTATITKTNNVQDTENKSAETEAPRVRKRRKMSHTVNELAKEIVFASNGTVLLEPDGAVLKCMEKIKKISETRTKNLGNGDVEEIIPTNEVKKLRVYGAKRPQTSILIKEKEADKDPDKIPRPPNAFMIFANEWRRKLAKKYPKETNTNISIKLGILWKGLSIEAKESYYRLAKRADEDHKRKYPNYYYSPKEARMRKKLKRLIKTKYLQPNTRGSDVHRIIKVYVNGEERQMDYYTDTDSSEYENEENHEDDEEDCKGFEVINYSEDEDDPAEKPDETSKRKDSVSSNKPSRATT